MSFMQHLRICNNFRPDEFVPLMVDDLLTGRVRPAFAAHLLGYSDVFQGDASRGVFLNSSITGFDERSVAVAAVVEGLASKGGLPPSPLARRHRLFAFSAVGQLNAVSPRLRPYYSFKATA